MFCRKCGNHIPYDSIYCQFCGNKIQIDNSNCIYKTLEITQQEANRGVTKNILVEGREKPLIIQLPSKLKQGHVFKIMRLKLVENNKKCKKNVYITIDIKEV